MLANTGMMCSNLPFCVGDNVHISDARASPSDCQSTTTHNALVMSIGMTLASPVAKVACVLDLAERGSPVRRLTMTASTLPIHQRYDETVVLMTTCGTQFRLCRKVQSNTPVAGNLAIPTNAAPVSPALALAQKHMRVLHVFRLHLENAFLRNRTTVGNMKESRRSGRRSALRFKDTFTLAEWDALVIHMIDICSGFVIKSPPSPAQPHQPGTPLGTHYEEKEMTIETVDFLSLMKTMGHFDAKRFLKYLAVAHSARGATPADCPKHLRIIGDYVSEEPGKPLPGCPGPSSDRECIITLGSTISSIPSATMLPDRHRCVVLRRQSCEFDARERAYVYPMELEILPSARLLDTCSDVTKENNRVYYTGEKKKTKHNRFLGFRWSRLSRMDNRKLFYDITDAEEILGEIQLHIPILTFFGGKTALEISNLCNENALLELFSLRSTTSRNQT